ncbi:hypothetical protein BofuT4_P032020.1 [Botrytis cinerea T4]|uniref:Uncharacterized protein n=1 Tax=Botryotinia fuckeliana (strain T4) TaxID=999810 RepID=G2Y9Q0_BOTF4|nr:hypothetical protein BofuT4_P032020.1 [Botrytis cinerea T4]
MPTFRQQLQSIQAQLHAIREEQNWIHEIQRTDLGLAMDRHARELIIELGDRNNRHQINQNPKPRLKFTLSPRSLVLTITEPFLKMILAAHILVSVFIAVLFFFVPIAYAFFVVCGARIKATLFLFLGRVYLLWVCNLWRMWYVDMGDLRFRLRMTGYMTAIGMVLWILAMWQNVKIF